MTAVPEPSFRGTPFNPRTEPLNQSGRWASWNQYHLPEVFIENGYDAEVKAMRETAILEDKSPLIMYFFSGPDALTFLNRLIPRDASKIEVLHTNYTPVCNEAGKLITDGLLFCVDENTYAFTAGRMDAWLAQQADGLNVHIEERTEEIGILHLQGPKALEILEAATKETWSDLRFSRGRLTEIAGVQVHAWRQGFTGERGYEFWVPAEDAIPVWDALWNTGESFGISPCGHNTQDVGRVEAGLILPAIDYTCAGPDNKNKAHAYGAQDPEFQASPHELGLDRFVDLTKEDFVGKASLGAELIKGGPRRRLVGLEINWQEIVDLYNRFGLPPEITRRVHRFPTLRLNSGGRMAGLASSATWSPTLKKMIGFGRVEVNYMGVGTSLSLDWTIQGKTGEVGATVVELPFVSHRR